MTGDMRKEAVTRAAASTMKVKAPLMEYVVSYGYVGSYRMMIKGNVLGSSLDMIKNTNIIWNIIIRFT